MQEAEGSAGRSRSINLLHDEGSRETIVVKLRGHGEVEETRGMNTTVVGSGLQNLQGKNETIKFQAAVVLCAALRT